MKTILKIFTVLLLFALPAHADLTAVVTPGYQFPLDGSVAPSYQLLNELAEPTIQIYGTIGGSNTLAPGSITTVSFSPSVVDGTTIGFNGSSPAGLQVLAGGIIGPGLQTLSTTNFELFVDTNVFLLATNSVNNTNSNTGSANKFWLTLQPQSLTDTNISPSAAIQPSKLTGSTNGNFVLGSTNGSNPTFILLPTNVFTLTPQTNSAGQTNLTLGLVTNIFISQLFTLPSFAGVVANTPHGLALSATTGGFTNAPSHVQWVMVCVTPNCGYVAGDEVEPSAFFSGSIAPDFSFGANATNVFMIKHAPLSTLFNKVSGVSDGSVTEADWKAKCYARP